MAWFQVLLDAGASQYWSEGSPVSDFGHICAEGLHDRQLLQQQPRLVSHDNNMSQLSKLLFPQCFFVKLTCFLVYWTFEKESSTTAVF